MRFAIGRRIRHPFYPAVKASFARAAKGNTPAVYGSIEDLWSAAGSGIRVDRAVFPLRRLSEPFLTDLQRESLWQVFRVPIYALLVDRAGKVIGCECEAQDGLHLCDPRATGLLPGRIESKLCECGRPGLRLMPPASQPERADEPGSVFTAG